MTLILSASDFAFYDDGALNNARTGSAILHSDIDSVAKGYDSGSLPSSSYCRGYATADGSSPVKLIVATVSSSVDGGAYSGSWGDNAISVRAWIRRETYTPVMGITLKSYHTPSAQTKPRGYSVRFSSLYANLIASDGAGGGDNYAASTNTFLESTKWHRIRLDYIPVGTLKDVLNFYTASAGGTNTETWELVDTLTILPSDGWYITASTPSAVGYYVDNFSDANTIYIDDFDVFVTPVG